MDTKDLMICDWVLYNGEPYQIRQLGICGVDRDGEDYPAVCIDKPKGIDLIIERNEIEPIPLTTKILEKNEFYYENNVGHVLEYYNYEIIYDTWEHELRILKDREQILKIKTFDKMCIHTLQHALKLCGIDKEIII